MAVVEKVIARKTAGHADMHDLTQDVDQAIHASGLTEGIACLFVSGSTCGLTTIEFESGCVSDFKRLFDEIANPDREYQHHLRWGDGNGHSHVRAALLGPSLSFPFSHQRAQLGTWQQIILVDFDNKARNRELILKLVGE